MQNILNTMIFLKLYKAVGIHSEPQSWCKDYLKLKTFWDSTDAEKKSLGISFIWLKVATSGYHKSSLQGSFMALKMERPLKSV